MANPVYILFKLKDQTLAGPLDILGLKGLWEGLEFETSIGNSYGLNIESDDFFYLNRPIRLVLEMDSFVPHLYRAVVRGEELTKVELHWPHFAAKGSKEEIYLRHDLYPVKISSMAFSMPDVKDPRFERYNHLVTLEMRYHWAEITYLQGHHWTKVEWYRAMEDGLAFKNEYERKLFESDLGKSALTDDLPLATGASAAKKEFSLFGAGWEHIDESLRQEKNACEGDRIRLLVDVEGGYEGESVRFELYSSSDKGGSAQIGSATGTIKKGTGSAEWTVDLSRAKGKPAEARIHFEPVVRGKYGEKCPIPLGQRKITCEYVEIPDILFHFDSAIPCIDPEGRLAGTMITALRHAQEHPDREAVLFGHTDVAGKDEYNFDLSADRGASIKAILDGDEGLWADIARRKSKPQSYQQILKTLHTAHGWPCDPGAVDGKPGPRTKAGVEAFQREYNRRFNQSITVDGTIGPQTWRALLKAVRGIIEEGFGGELPRLSYGYEGKGLYPCGESFPLTGIAGTDAKNRRVEIVFFEKGKAPKLMDHPDKKKKVSVAENPVYDEGRTERKVIETTAIRTHGEDRWIIFEEASGFLDISGHYERWEPGSAKSRWIYVFGSTERSKTARVWEIKTDKNGKFATYEITPDTYNSRSQSEMFEDVALLPAEDEGGRKYTFHAALSEIRLPVSRLFNTTTGIAANPSKRCVNIDDNRQVARKVDLNGEEHVILINHLRRADELRKSFDTASDKLENLRLPASGESDPDRKKSKLAYEFGGLLLYLTEANPGLEKNFDPASLKQLRYDVQAFDGKKASATGEVSGCANQLCAWLNREDFSEVCRDYCALIKKGDKQPDEFYAFENRMAALLVGLSRIVEGNQMLRSLLPKVKSAKEQSWLQDLLLLRDDVWSVPEKITPVSEKYEHFRVISEGLLTLMQEAAVSGIGTFSPQEMASIMGKVFSTTGESVFIGIVTTPRQVRAGTKPFYQVLGSLSEDSFWRFEFPKPIVGKGLTKFLTSDGMDRTLAILNGISVAFTLHKTFEKEAKSGEEKWERVKAIIELQKFVLENCKVLLYKGKLVKVGGGPVAALGAINSLIDARISFEASIKAAEIKDYDLAAWKAIATGGFLMSAAGSAALAATFFTGAAAASLTGIGIAPAFIMIAIGTLIATGATIKANRNELELLIQKTPWGLNPEDKNRTKSSPILQTLYAEILAILNSFSVEINTSRLTAMIATRNLEPDTHITLHIVEFGKGNRSTTVTSSGNSFDTQIVGKDILLNDSNCVVKKGQSHPGWEIFIDFEKICSGSSTMFWKAQSPDTIRVVISIDLFGDKEILLPASGKRLVARSYNSGPTTVLIQGA